jgi:hypothetical protein
MREGREGPRSSSAAQDRAAQLLRSMGQAAAAHAGLQPATTQLCNLAA